MNSFRKKFILAVISMLGLSATSLFTVSEGKLSVGQMLAMTKSKLGMSTKDSSSTKEKDKDNKKGKKDDDDDGEDDETGKSGKGKADEDKEDDVDGVDGVDDEEEEENDKAAGTNGKGGGVKKQLSTTGAKNGTAALLQSASDRGGAAPLSTARQNTGLLTVANRYDPAADYSLEGLSGQSDETQSPLVKLQTDMVAILSSLDAFWPKTGIKNAKGHENRGPNRTIQTLGDLRRLVNLDSLSRVLPPEQMATINGILSNKDEATGQELPLNTNQVLDKAVNVAKILSIYYNDLRKRVEELKKSEDATNGGLTDQQRASALNALAANMQNVFRNFNTQSDLDTLSSIFAPGVSSKMRKERLGDFLQRKGFSKEDVSNYTSDDGIVTFGGAVQRYFEQLEKIRETQAAGPNGSKAPQTFIGGPQMNNFDPVKAERVHVMSIIASEVYGYGVDPASFETYIASKYNELSQALIMGLNEIPLSGAQGNYAYRLKAIFDDKIDRSKFSVSVTDDFVKKCVKSLKETTTAFSRFTDVIKEITNSSSAGYKNYFESRVALFDEARMDAVKRVSELSKLYGKYRNDFDSSEKVGAIYAGRLFYNSDTFKDLFAKSAADSSTSKEDGLKVIGINPKSGGTADLYGAFIRKFMTALEKEKAVIENLTNGLQPFGAASEEYYAKISYSDYKNRINAFIKVVDVVYPILRFLFSPISDVVKNEQIAIDAGVPRDSLEFLRNLESYKDDHSVATILGDILALQMNLVRYINAVPDANAFNDSVGKKNTAQTNPFVTGTANVTNAGDETITVSYRFHSVTGLLGPGPGKDWTTTTAWDGDAAGVQVRRFLDGVFTLGDYFGREFGKVLKDIESLDGGAFVSLVSSGTTLGSALVPGIGTSKFVKIGNATDGVAHNDYFTPGSYKYVEKVDPLIAYFLGTGNTTKDFETLNINTGNDSEAQLNFKNRGGVLRNGRVPDILYLFMLNKGVQIKLNSFDDRMSVDKMGVDETKEFTTHDRAGKNNVNISLKQAGAFLVAGDDNYVPTSDKYMPKKEVVPAENEVAKYKDNILNMSAAKREELRKSLGWDSSSTPVTVGSTTPNFYYNGGYGYGPSTFSGRRTGIYSY